MVILSLAFLLMLRSDLVFGSECLCWVVGLFANNLGRYWIIRFGLLTQGRVCWIQR